MDEPKKKAKRGRRARARFQRRLARMQADAATTHNPSTRPQLTTGAGAGQTPPSGPRLAQDRDGQRGGGEVVSTPPVAPETPPGPQTALFERRDNIRSDARLVAKAIEFGWIPRSEVTEAIMTKASMQALADNAKPHEVTAVAKLHLVARSQEMAHAHHQERMDYHERALSLRREQADIDPVPSVVVNNNGQAAVSIYIPENFRDSPQPEDIDEPQEMGESNDRNLLH